ncbi:MAG: AIM24 family protein, partial [Planctomycetes bacterium]|nr:AIM24 family protein [Planctomycetota bacterium]
ILFGGTGFFIDTFSCLHGEGVLWLHGYGNVFEAQLGKGEQIDIEPGGWVYKDRSVQMTSEFQRLSTGLFAGTSICWNRFTGPGRVGLQSMYVHLPTEA